MDTAAQQVLQLPELVELILLSLSTLYPIINEYEDPRSEAISTRSRVLSTLLHAQRVCRTWQRTINSSKAVQRALYLAPNTTCSASWTATSERGLIPPTLIPSAYRYKPGSQPQLNPILQHRFPGTEFRFSPPNVMVMSKRHQAHMIVKRTDCHSWTSSPPYQLYPPSEVFDQDTENTDELATELHPSWSRMQLSAPPVLEVAATVWDRTRKLTDGVMPPSAFYLTKRVNSSTGVTMGMLLDAVSRMFEEDEALNEIKVCTI